MFLRLRSGRNPPPSNYCSFTFKRCKSVEKTERQSVFAFTHIVKKICWFNLKK